MFKGLKRYLTQVIFVAILVLCVTHLAMYLFGYEVGGNNMLEELRQHKRADCFLGKP